MGARSRESRGWEDLQTRIDDSQAEWSGRDDYEEPRMNRRLLEHPTVDVGCRIKISAAHGPRMVFKSAVCMRNFMRRLAGALGDRTAAVCQRWDADLDLADVRRTLYRQSLDCVRRRARAEKTSRLGSCTVRGQSSGQRSCARRQRPERPREDP